MSDYKFGKRPPKNHPALMLGPLLTGVVPAHPTSVDYLARLPNWQMLGNDQYGDCVAVMWANMRREITAELGAAEVYPDQSMVYEVYKTQNPNFPADDNGMDEQTLFEYLVSTGGPDGVKALAFAKVDTTNLAQMDAAVSIFGGLCYGINVLNANLDEFDAGQPWDYVAGSPVAGGHAVWGGGYSESTPQDDERFITWATETSFTDAFVANQMDEAWVVIWPEHLGSKAFQQGVDLAALAAAYEALTGRPFPVPTPAPNPTPGPNPTPTPDTADATLAAAVRVWAGHRHSGATRKVAAALVAWLKAKGL